MLRVDHAAVVELLETAYGNEHDGYVNHVLHALMAMVGARSAAFFRFSSAYDSEGRFHLRSVEDVSFVGPDAARTSKEREIILGDHFIAEASWGKTQGSVNSIVTGLGERLAHVPGWRDCWRAPVVDTIGLASVGADARGVSVCAGLDRLGTISPREARLLTRLATHLGAGDRLRAIERARRLEEADAVFSATGTLLHVHDDGAERVGASAARAGVEARNFARRTRHDVEKALDVWQGLVDGRWSIVDHLDTDGKRLVLALKNAPRVAPRADLAPEERRVAALAAMGHSDKEIAYALGRPRTAVSKSLDRARRKLGARTRAELAAIWRTRAEES